MQISNVKYCLLITKKVLLPKLLLQLAKMMLISLLVGLLPDQSYKKFVKFVQIIFLSNKNHWIVFGRCPGEDEVHAYDSLNSYG